MSGVVSHDTTLMREWAQKLGENTETYDQLIERLYNLINQFVGSSEFKGGLSTDFEDKVISQKPEFLKYSNTFRECIELINNRATDIDNDESELRSAINSANPLG